jgi:hypothetical protein
LKPERWGSPLVQEKYQEEKGLWHETTITTTVVVVVVVVVVITNEDYALIEELLFQKHFIYIK